MSVGMRERISRSRSGPATSSPTRRPRTAPLPLFQWSLGLLEASIRNSVTSHPHRRVRDASRPLHDQRWVLGDLHVVQSFPSFITVGLKDL